MRAALPTPGLFTHLWLLWGLRLQTGMNRQGRFRALPVVAFIASSLPALALGAAFHWLITLDYVRSSWVWESFLLNLLCFVTSAVFVTWPIMSAGVDDHSELSRFVAFPISSWRLLVASVVAALFEPRALVFFAPLVGATVGYLENHPQISWLAAAPLLGLYALMNAAWGRVGLNVVINVLRAQRSAQLIGGFGFAFLFLAALIPPVDLSWLKAVGPEEELDLAIVAEAAVALGRFPTGFYGSALRLTATGHGAAVLFALGIGGFLGAGLWLAHRLLVRFHRQVGRSGPPQRHAASNPFAREGTRARALWTRELFDLWNNPRARLLVAVPFILAILIKLLSGRELIAHFAGPLTDAWLLGGLALYGAIVIGSTFSQNTFGYDGRGMAMFAAAPLDLGEVLRAKNRVHAGAALAMAGAVAVFYRAYFGHGSAADVATCLAAALTLVPVLLAAGNFISVYFPVKFHASLKRRDKLPFVASMLGVFAAAAGSLPFAWALRSVERTSAATAAALLLTSAAAWGGYLALLPLATRILAKRRERILAAVTRE